MTRSKPKYPVEARYPFDLMWSDFALSLVGVCLATAVLFTSTANLPVKVVVGLFLLASLWFFTRTCKLFYTVLWVGETDLKWCCFGRAKSQEIMDLRKVKLRFYGSVRQKSKGLGVYHLTLTFKDGTKFFADQRLDEFQAVIEAVGKIGPKVQIDVTSRQYLSVFGF